MGLLQTLDTNGAEFKARQALTTLLQKRGDFRVGAPAYGESLAALAVIHACETNLFNHEGERILALEAAHRALFNAK